MKNDLSTTELYLWHKVEENREVVKNMSITDLSEYTNVSTATIVRTLKKMGFTGYPAYKETIRQKSKRSSNYKVMNEADIEIQQVIIKNEIELNNTLRNLDYRTIQESIYKIQQANLIYIFARGFSESIAQELQIKLQLSGKYTEFYTDPNIIRKISQRISKNNAVIFISLNGETEELVFSSQELSKNKVPKITFTTNGTSSLAKTSDFLFLGYKTKKTYFPEYEVQSRLTIQVMVRIFIDAYMIRTQKSNL